MASLDGDITIKGMKQGAFQGQNPVKSRAGSTVVTAVSNEIITPSDNISGLSTGKRRYGAYIVTMSIDKSVINHQVAISTNEVLSTVSIRLYQLAGASLNQVAGAGGAGGESKPYYTVLLEQAILTQFEIVYPDVRSQDPFIKNRDPYMRAHFTFQKVTGTWIDGGVTFTDEWSAVS
jgi:type VI secretion system Hcp family effector